MIINCEVWSVGSFLQYELNMIQFQNVATCLLGTFSKFIYERKYESMNKTIVS